MTCNALTGLTNRLLTLYPTTTPSFITSSSSSTPCNYHQTVEYCRQSYNWLTADWTSYIYMMSIKEQLNTSENCTGYKECFMWCPKKLVHFPFKCANIDSFLKRHPECSETWNMNNKGYDYCECVRCSNKGCGGGLSMIPGRTRAGLYYSICMIINRMLDWPRSRHQCTMGIWAATNWPTQYWA